MREWRVVVAAIVVVSAMCASRLEAQNAPLIVGTWKLNPAKSKYEPGSTRMLRPRYQTIDPWSMCPCSTLP